MMKAEDLGAALEGNINYFDSPEMNRRHMSSICNKVSPSGNSLLHIAASSGHAEMTNILAREFPFMINKTNCQDDTPLHVAARAGRLNTVTILVKCAATFAITSQRDCSFNLLKLKNRRGNTPLHEALFTLLEYPMEDESLKRKKEDVVALARCLVSADPDVAYCENNEGTSPLCLAVESGNIVFLDYILNALPGGDDCVGRLEGKSPVHAAIEQNKLDVLESINKQKPQLLNKRDEKENTPLHYAATIGYVEGIKYLLDIKSEDALQRNNKGLYPLHLACENGSIEVVKMLLRRWPDPTELYNNKGQNILHVAAKNGHVHVVRYLLKEENIDNLFNDRDHNGNTPLHLAALRGQCLVISTLLWLDRRRRTKLEVKNNHGLTPYDICARQSAILNPDVLLIGKEVLMLAEGEDQKIDEKILKELNSYDDEKQSPAKEQSKKSKSEPDLYNQGEGKDQKIDDEQKSAEKELSKKSKSEPDHFYKMMMTLSIFYVVHNFRAFCAGGDLMKGYVELVKPKPFRSVPPKKEDVKERINSLIVVAALIAGAAFTALIQVVSADSDSESQKDEGIEWFLFFDTISMYASITAAIILTWAQMLDIYLSSITVWVASLIVGLSLYTGCFAFFAAFLTKTQYPELAVALNVLCLCVLVLRSYQLILPFKSKSKTVVVTYFIHFCYYFILDWFYYLLPEWFRKLTSFNADIWFLFL